MSVVSWRQQELVLPVTSIQRDTAIGSNVLIKNYWMIIHILFSLRTTMNFSFASTGLQCQHTCQEVRESNIIIRRLVSFSDLMENNFLSERCLEHNERFLARHSYPFGDNDQGFVWWHPLNFSSQTSSPTLENPESRRLFLCTRTILVCHRKYAHTWSRPIGRDFQTTRERSRDNLFFAFTKKKLETNIPSNGIQSQQGLPRVFPWRVRSRWCR